MKLNRWAGVLLFLAVFPLLSSADEADDALFTFRRGERVAAPPQMEDEYEPRALGKALGVVTTVSARLEGCVEIGYRSLHFELTDNKKDEVVDGERRGFLGSINELEEEQTYAPYPFFRLFPIPRFRYVGLEIGYDVERAITRKWTDPPPGGSRDDDSDGTIDLRGPTLQLVARYHDWKWLVPYLSVGYVFYQADFEHEEWWHMGFASYMDPEYYAWVESGRSYDPSGGKRRTIELDDTQGTIFALGVSAKIWKGFQLEADARYVEADVDASYTLSWGDRVFPQYTDRRLYFPMSSWGYRIGLKYLF